MDEQGIGELSNLLRTSLASGPLSQTHWLAWVVYAAEEGYTYTGEEYWRSFEEHTPHWEAQHRNTMRNWFRRFQKNYNGVCPTGAWAKNFGIIAWPITHAILPRYLQRHFAKALHASRFRLVELTSLEPKMIGQMFTTDVRHSSTRFGEFLQQEELVGRFVLALLNKDSHSGEALLLCPTLKRIVRDLEKVRHGREWLEETGSVFSRRVKGIGRGSGSHEYQADTVPGSRLDESKPKLDIRPSLLLRRNRDGSWSLAIDCPSFNRLAALNADVREFLVSARCSLNGSEGMESRGWVMSGNRKAILESWPDPEKPLISFERRQPVVDYVLECDFRMTRGSVWLFRVGRDGIAREITSRIIRPGSDYIIVSRDSITNLLDGMSDCSVKCHGVVAVRVSDLKNVSDEDIQWFNNLGFQFERTVRVWPAGLCARNWDGEGHSEWLTTERPCFGIVPDHPVESYELSLDNDTSTFVRANEVGQPTFIQLPRLKSGVHLLAVKAHKDIVCDGVVKSIPHVGNVRLRVREPEPWIPGTTAHAGLIVVGDPHDANLDNLWDNEYALSVIGPSNHSVTAEVILEDGMGETLFSGNVLESATLPIEPEFWRKRFRAFQKRRKCEFHHLEASDGILRIDGQELGEFTIRFEHEALPLRWVRRRDQGKLIVRLIDETGQGGCELECECFSMKEPVKGVRHKVADLLSGVEVQSPGGLFVAQSGNHRDLIMVSAGLTADGLGGLGVTPNFGKLRQDSSAVAEALRILSFWQDARLMGFVANARRQQVVDGLLGVIYGALCGSSWADAEAIYFSSRSRARKKKQALNKLRAELKEYGGFEIVLLRDAVEHSSGIDAITEWYKGLAKRYSNCDDCELCSFAIRLACHPHRLLRFFQGNFEELLDRIIAYPHLLQGARLAAISCADKKGYEGMRLPRW